LRGKTGGVRRRKSSKDQLANAIRGNVTEEKETEWERLQHPRNEEKARSENQLLHVRFIRRGGRPVEKKIGTAKGGKINP